MRRSARSILVAVALGLVTASFAQANPVAAGRAAYTRGDYVGAARLLGPAAARGNASAQALLGYMYANGQGVPQGYDAATYWYRLAAEQGETTAQYLLGLMYDKGFGVPLNEVAAHMWLNLAAAHAPQRNREYYMRLRDAVASKMTRGQIDEAQWRAQEWAARPRPISVLPPN